MMGLFFQIDGSTAMASPAAAPANSTKATANPATGQGCVLIAYPYQ